MRSLTEVSLLRCFSLSVKVLNDSINISIHRAIKTPFITIMSYLLFVFSLYSKLWVFLGVRGPKHVAVKEKTYIHASIKETTATR